MNQQSNKAGCSPIFDMSKGCQSLSPKLRKKKSKLTLKAKETIRNVLKSLVTRRS